MQQTSAGGNPPYVSFFAFDAFVAEIALQGLPRYCDKSVFASFSDAVRVQLVPALRFLKLLTADRIATPALHALADAHGTSRYPQVLRRLLDQAYELTDVDLSTATPSQFAAAFERLGCSASALRKAQVFYLKACHVAGHTIGPRLAYGRPSIERRSPVIRSGRRRVARNDAADSLELRRDLIRKYPEFDPDWPERLQIAWLEGFRSLVPLQA